MREEHKDPRGGLTQKGRDYFKRKQGSNLKPPVKSGSSGKSGQRRINFAHRFKGVKGPLKDEKGRPTRLKLAMSRWGFGSREAMRNFSERHKKA